MAVNHQALAAATWDCNDPASDCPPDSPTRGQDLHLDQVGLLAQDLLDEIMDYPYDSKGPDTNSKSRKRFGKPRSPDGWIKAINKYGRL